MKKEIPQPVLIGTIIMVVLLVLGVGWYMFNQDTATIVKGPSHVAPHLPRAFNSDASGPQSTAKSMLAPGSP